jgi:hypothetical protein
LIAPSAADASVVGAVTGVVATGSTGAGATVGTGDVTTGASGTRGTVTAVATAVTLFVALSASSVTVSRVSFKSPPPVNVAIVESTSMVSS